jgi:predicted RNase H-like HicB family nuclease
VTQLAATAPAATDHERDPIPFGEDELVEARRYSMLVQWSPADEAWIVTVPEIGNARTHGASPAEAVVMGADLVASYLDFCRRRNEEVPAPRFFEEPWPVS